jgi:hypothetical protein
VRLWAWEARVQLLLLDLRQPPSLGRLRSWIGGWRDVYEVVEWAFEPPTLNVFDKHLSRRWLPWLHGFIATVLVVQLVTVTSEDFRGSLTPFVGTFSFEQRSTWTLV